MTVLRVVDWGALLFGVVNTVSMAAVCLMIWTYRAEAAELGVRLLPLVAVTGALAGFTAVAASAVWALRRESAWHWLAQMGLVVTAGGTGMLLWSLT